MAINKTPIKRRYRAAWAVLTTAEQQRLIEATLKSERNGLRDATMISTALGSGLRVQELASLTVDSVMTPTGRIKQMVEPPFAKNGVKDPVYFGEPLRKRLAVWIDELRRQSGSEGLNLDGALWPGGGTRSGAIGSPLTARQLQRILKARLAEAGIERRIRFHDLRHTYGTRAATITGGDIPKVQALLRHADPRTSAVYVHVNETDLLKAADEVLVA